jgi:hypothetical protein
LGQKEAMKNDSITETRIYTENDAAFRAKWFSGRKEKNFIKHVDTLYFMVTPAIKDYRESPEWENYITVLSDKKDKSRLIHENIPIFTDIHEGLETNGYIGAQMYSLHFGLEDSFDVFTCSGALTDKTPPIMVQIRSNSLWLDGMKGAFDKAFDCVEKILKSFGIQIKSIQENRIDYAFHTNYINDHMSFFAEKDLGKMFVGNFKRGRKDYNFHSIEEDEHGDREVECDYITLGRHKSNNVFFRAYNKTKEVIERGYKQFFIPIWEDYGLINKFDKYILEKAFKTGKYEEKDRARCEFYYDYGKNDEIRREIYEKLQNSDTPAKWFTKRAKLLVPDITIITNIEIQTKRKFYERLKKPLMTNDETARKTIYSLFTQMNDIIEFITKDTVRFVKYKGKYAKIHRTERPMSDWWLRLRRAKAVEIGEDYFNLEYIRHYQHDMNLERQKILTVGKLASMGAYTSIKTGIFETAKESESTVAEDMIKLLELMNDNDVSKYYKRRTKKQKEIMRNLE